jgi:hypothetical protein
VFFLRRILGVDRGLERGLERELERGVVVGLGFFWRRERRHWLAVDMRAWKYEFTTTGRMAKVQFKSA